jgi:hypothetical protein
MATSSLAAVSARKAANAAASPELSFIPMSHGESSSASNVSSGSALAYLGMLYTA